MKILAVDTSTRNLSVAVLSEGKILSEFNGKARLRHSQDLIPTIKKLLKTSQLGLDGLDGFAVSAGPGSFTGLRIGVATVKGLGLVTGKPIAPVPTLDVIAGNIKKDFENICVIVDAKKSKIYACVYAHVNGKIEKKTDHLLTTVDELLKKVDSHTLFLGDGVGLYKTAILNKAGSAHFGGEDTWFPRAATVAELGTQILKKGGGVSGDELAPMYLYSRECSIRGIDR